jgi:serine/threonine-protein kinase
MPLTSTSESSAGRVDEERILQVLVTRGLVTRDEADQCRASGPSPSGADSLLVRLVQANCLTPEQARRVSQEFTLPVAHQIPGYQLQDRIGHGSMGIVFKARQLSMDRPVAIKVLHPRLAANPKDLERFLREAHLAAKLSHSNIIQAIDAGSTGKVHYFVMEYVEGTTIDQHLRAGKIYGEQEALVIILQIARALEHAHSRQLIHRDVKPANVVLTADGTAKLADLGLARQVVGDSLEADEKGLVIGTPFYIAPEQIHGRQDIDTRADIYSLGATLYHMVTGQPPYPGTEVDSVLTAHLKQDLVPPDHMNTSLSAGLGELVELMMAKSPNQRYQTPSDLIIDLECLLAGQPPKLARQRIEMRVLEALKTGKKDVEESETAQIDYQSNTVDAIWIWLLGALLAISVLLNILLMIKK